MSLSRCLCLAFVLACAAHSHVASGAPYDQLSITTATTKLHDAWTVDASASATVELKEGVLELHAPQNTFAHIEHALTDEGPFRASCSINSPPTAKWAPSMFLYWDTHTWVQMGYIAGNDLYHLNGPGLYAVIMDDGKRVENRLTTTAGSDFRLNEDHGGLDMIPVETVWLDAAIAVGPDSLFFQIRRGGSWETQLVLPRQSLMKQMPKLLVLGKGMSEPGDFPAADLDNNSKDIGKVVTSRIRNVQVEPVDSAVLRASEIPAEHYRDVAGQKELDRPGDPDFDSVAAHWPGLKYSREVVGVKDHAHEFAILPNGAITYHHSHWCWFNVGNDQKRFGSTDLPAKSLELGWLPIVTSKWTHDGLTYEQTAFAWSEKMSPDTPTEIYVRMKVLNPGNTPATARLSLFDNRKKGEIANWDKLNVPANGETSVWFKGSPEDKEPFKPVHLKQEDFDSRMREVSSSWTDETKRGMQIDIPEERIMNAWKAWLAYTYVNTDKLENRYELHDGGAGFYELVYGFSASQACQVLDQMGRHDDARRYLDAMTKMGNKEGLFVINFGLPDQGALLNALCFHYDMTGDKEWFASVSPTMIKMCEWIKTERAKQKKSQDPNAASYGMIKGRPYCDHPDPGYYVIADVLMATGMEKSARLLEDSGNKDAAAWIAEEAVAYKKDLHEVLKKCVFSIEGHKLVALFPDTRELLRASGWFTSNYYSACVPSLLESGGDLVSLDSEYSKIIVDSLEQRGGLLMGMTRFWGGIDHAYTSGYWYNRLMHAEPEKALLGLYGSLAYGMSRDTFAAVEVTFCKEGKSFPTLPHSYSNLQQLRLVRNLLVLEQDKTLALGAGIARPWLEKGKHVAVDHAATKFGEVSYRIESLDNGKMRVSLTPPKSAGAVKLWLRHPEEKKIKRVTVGGKPASNVTLGGEWFETTELKQPVIYEVEFQ